MCEVPGHCCRLGTEDGCGDLSCGLSHPWGLGWENMGDKTGLTGHLAEEYPGLQRKGDRCPPPAIRLQHSLGLWACLGTSGLVPSAYCIDGKEYGVGTSEIEVLDRG